MKVVRKGVNRFEVNDEVAKAGKKKAEDAVSSLAGSSFGSLSRADKDTLLLALLQERGVVDENGKVCR